MRGPGPDLVERSGRYAFWRALALAIIVPAFFIGLALWLGGEYHRLSRDDEELNRAYSLQLDMAALFSSMKDAETGQRGFVITGNPAFLAPYQFGKADVSAYWSRLFEDFPTGDTAVRGHLSRLKTLTTAKFDEMQRVIDVRQSQGLDAAAVLVAAGRGKRLMDQIRAEAGALEESQQRALDDQLARQRQRTRFTQTIIWMIVGVFSALFISAAAIFWRNSRSRHALALEARDAAIRQRAIFEHALDAIILINPSGSIETMNPAAVHLFGYEEDSLIRRDIAMIVDIAPGEGAFLDRLGHAPGGLAQPVRTHLHARRSDGSTVPVEAALGIMPLPDGPHIVAAFRDLSEREKVEHIKDQFLSTVSHELRTPLTSIVGSLGLLRGGVADELSPDAQRLVVIAENNAGRLIRLVNDLLDIEKLESGAMTFAFEPLDVRQAAAHAVDVVRGVATVRGVDLQIEPGRTAAMVRGDRDRLIQVMINLLSNAVRFSPTAEAVRLAIDILPNELVVTVRDHGPGIDKELSARLFTRFAQSLRAPSTGNATPGTGLGLAISREIVRNHGGAIWYEPAPDGGSAFKFSLPLWNVLTSQSDLNGAPRVLICAEQSEAADIASAFANRSIRADVVQDEKAVLDAARGRHYLALLLDCACLQVNGISLLRQIRSDPQLRMLPVIALSAGDDEALSEIAALDIIDWIPRPIDRSRLNEAVSSIMDRAVSTMPLVLHVDDDSDTLEITSSALAGRARMARAPDLASARAFIADQHPDVVVVDLALPDGSGHDLIADLSAPGTDGIPVIVYSAQDSGGLFARDVAAVLTKSRRSLPSLVETVVAILDQQETRKDISDEP